jgi:hypothetical protein
MAVMEARNRKKIVRIRFSLPVIAALVPLATVVNADGFNYGIDAGIGESDNVTLVETNKVSQTMAIADLDFSVKEKGSRLDEDIVGDFTYLDFLQNAYGSEVLGRLNGAVRYALVPESLTWTLQDNWGQEQLSPFAPLVPTNQENVNYLSTGPDWYAHLGGTNFMDVGARYSRADYTVTPISNGRVLGSLQLGHEISGSSSLSLNFSVERVLYENTALNTDYDLSNAYARYELHGARTDLSVNLGVNRVTQDGVSNSGLSTQLELKRKISDAAKITVTAGRELTDASAGFNALQSSNSVNAVNVNNVVSNSPSAINSDIFLMDYIVAAWSYERRRTTFGLSARWEKDDYLNQSEFNGTRNRLDVNVERQLTHALSAQLFGNLYQSRYDHDLFIVTDTGYTEQDGLYGLSLVLREGKGLEIRLRYDHLSRDISAGAGTGYGENRVFLTIGYRPQPQP